jgi:hypothetical protein
MSRLCAVIVACERADVTELRHGNSLTAVASRSARTPLLAVAAFLLLTAPLTLVVGLSAPHRFSARALTYLTGPAWLDGWIEYDSGWYYRIVTDGYFFIPGQQSSIAFFPSYPVVVRGVAALLGDVQVAGMLVTLVAGAGAIGLFAVWAGDRLSPAATVTAVLLALLYPYAFFVHATMYADAVFLLTVIGAFVLLERGHPVLAGLVGICATAGRPVGVALTVGLVLRLLEIRAAGGTGASATSVRLRNLPDAVRRLRPADYGVLLSVLGFAGWCAYLSARFGNPLAFVAAESAPGWDQGAGPWTWFKLVFVGTLLRGPPDIALTLAVQAVLCLGAVLLFPRIRRLFGWGYLAYVLVAVGIPLIGTKDFMGTGRYLLAAFPVFAAAADLLTSVRHGRVLRAVVLTLFAAGLVAGTMLYARGYEVS